VGPSLIIPSDEETDTVGPPRGRLRGDLGEENAMSGLRGEEEMGMGSVRDDNGEKDPGRKLRRREKE